MSEEASTENGTTAVVSENLSLELDATDNGDKGEVVKADVEESVVGPKAVVAAESDEKGEFVIRARGLPWSATEADLRKFFADSGDEMLKVTFTYNREGRPSGEAYIQFSTKSAFDSALTKDHTNMGHRYIEVFASEKSEMEEVTSSAGKTQGSFKDDSDPVVRLRGLPYGCTKEEISNFFSGLEITPNGIVMPCDQTGRPSGEAFVQFMDKTTAEEAIKRHMRNIGSRYIEVFRSSRDELGSVMRRLGTPGVGMGGGGGGSPMGGGGGFGRAAAGAWGGSRGGPYEREEGRFGGGGAGRSWGGGGGGRYGFEEREPGFGSGGGPWANRGGGGAFGGGGGASFGGGGGGFGGYEASWDRPAGGGPMRSFGGGGRGGGRMGGGPWMGGGGGGGARGGGGSGGGSGSGTSIRMRGIPFSATERDIKEFFSPIRTANVEIETEPRSGRPSGEALVEFFTQSDASRGMERDRQHMGSRYVELFLN